MACNANTKNNTSLAITKARIQQFYGDNFRPSNVNIYTKCFSENLCNFQSFGTIPEELEKVVNQIRDENNHPASLLSVWALQGYSVVANNLRRSQNTEPFATNPMTSFVSGKSKSKGVFDLEKCDPMEHIRLGTNMFSKTGSAYRLEIIADYNNGEEVDQDESVFKLAINNLAIEFKRYSNQQIGIFWRSLEPEIFPAILNSQVSILYSIIHPLLQIHTENRQTNIDFLLSPGQIELVAVIENLIKYAINGHPKNISNPIFRNLEITQNLKNSILPQIPKHCISSDLAISEQFLEENQTTLQHEVTWRSRVAKPHLDYSEMLYIQFRLEIAKILFRITSDTFQEDCVQLFKKIVRHLMLYEYGTLVRKRMESLLKDDTTSQEFQNAIDSKKHLTKLEYIAGITSLYDTFPEGILKLDLFKPETSYQELFEIHMPNFVESTSEYRGRFPLAWFKHPKVLNEFVKKLHFGIPAIRRNTKKTYIEAFREEIRDTK